MNMLKIIKLADFFTLANLASGLIAIMLFLNNSFAAGSIFILAAVLFDFLDGKVARLTRHQNVFGKELDSLCDMVSFGIAPAVMVFAMSNNLTYIPLYVIFACAGALRLARFNISKTKGFEGMPITVNGILFPFLYFLNAPLIIIHIVMAVSAILMVSGLRFKKI